MKIKLYSEWILMEYKWSVDGGKGALKWITEGGAGGEKRGKKEECKRKLLKLWKKKKASLGTKDIYITVILSIQQNVLK